MTRRKRVRFRKLFNRMWRELRVRGFRLRVDGVLLTTEHRMVFP